MVSFNKDARKKSKMSQQKSKTVHFTNPNSRRSPKIFSQCPWRACLSRRSPTLCGDPEPTAGHCNFGTCDQTQVQTQNGQYWIVMYCLLIIFFPKHIILKQKPEKHILSCFKKIKRTKHSTESQVFQPFFCFVFAPSQQPVIFYVSSSSKDRSSASACSSSAWKATKMDTPGRFLCGSKQPG